SSRHVPVTHDTDPLTLHDALPISRYAIRDTRYAMRDARYAMRDARGARREAHLRLRRRREAALRPGASRSAPACHRTRSTGTRRSEEHTSELQSRENLVCRLLLEK